MQEFLERLKQHILDHPPDYSDGESILDVLLWHYEENHAIDSEKIREQFTALREIVNLPPEDYDAVFYAVSDLCLEHSRLAFEDGLKFGVLLMLELIKDRS